MNYIKDYYTKAHSALSAHRFVETTYWAHKTVDVICKNVYEEKSPNPDRKRFNEFIKDMEANEYVEKKIISSFKYIQQFRNEDQHDYKLDPNSLTDEDVKPVITALDYIMKWYRKEYPHHLIDGEEIKSNSSLEETLSNPHYNSDIKKLDANWNNYKSIIDDKTIIIVTGTHMIAELLDRPVAEMLRDEIEAKFGYRAIVISDRYYKLDSAMQTRPTISIGGNEVNSLSLEISKLGKTWTSYDGIYGASLDNKKALWGDSASKTRLSVESYIEKEEGLKAFINQLN